MPRLRRLSRSRIVSLENRIVPAVTIQAGVDLDADGINDDVQIIGGSENTKVIVQDDGFGSAALKLFVDINSDGDFTDAGELDAFIVNVGDDSCVIDLRMGSGNDEVIYGLIDNLVNSTRHLSIDLGSGNDKFQFGPNGHQIKTSTLLLVDILAGAGNDAVQMPATTIDSSDVLVDVNLGAGNDNYLTSASLTESIDGSGQLKMLVDLGAGTNLVLANANLNVGGTTAGSFSLDIIGGSGADEVALFPELIVGNGTLSSSVDYNVELGGGNDKFTSTNHLLDIRANSTLDIRASGGAGNDTMTAQFIDPATTQLAGLARFDLLGGLGNDILTSKFVGASLNQLVLTGKLAVTLSGQEGADTLEADAAFANTSTGNYSLIALGGSGNDKLKLGLTTNGATLTYGKSGKIVADGGQGTDSLDNNVSPASLVDAKFFETFI